jgi:bifunctional non-homologous end joining protein LigD
MGLEAYRSKRDFRQTPEPSGKPKIKQAGRLFVVQKHAARSLHYDFRLELDGTLKSWAVPKGPSLDPSEKRLAVHVEDHPVEYGGFEGIIPPNQYGSGTVLIWDRGTWEPVGDPRRGYRTGKLKFRLMGERLHGGWVLMRMGRNAEAKDNWLLIKEKDDKARSGPMPAVESVQTSVVSGRDLAQISAGKKCKVWQSKTPKKPPDVPSGSDFSAFQGARKASMFPAPRPQLATLVPTAPEEKNWLHEIKYDGYRILCRLKAGKATLYTRAGKDWTRCFSNVAKAAAELPAQQAWLDGEVVAVDADGATSFQALQNALNEEKPRDLIYYIFDVLYLDGYDLRDVSLIERKQIVAGLCSAADTQGPIRYSDHVASDGRSFYDLVCKRRLEGIISKRKDAPYREGRSRNWIKVKCLNRQEFVIGGFTEPSGSRKGFGALLLGVYDLSGHLHYSGRVGTGFNEDTLRHLHAGLKRLARKTSPFINPPEGVAARNVHWVKPHMVAEVSFTEWTDDGVLRHPSYLGLREDKPAHQVVREDRVLKSQRPKPRVRKKSGAV